MNHKFINIVMLSLGLDVAALEAVELHRKRSGRARYFTMESLTDLMFMKAIKFSCVTPPLAPKRNMMHAARFTKPVISETASFSVQCMVLLFLRCLANVTFDSVLTC